MLFCIRVRSIREVHLEAAQLFQYFDVRFASANENIQNRLRLVGPILTVKLELVIVLAHNFCQLDKHDNRDKAMSSQKSMAEHSLLVNKSNCDHNQSGVVVDSWSFLHMLTSQDRPGVSQY